MLLRSLKPDVKCLHCFEDVSLKTTVLMRRSSSRVSGGTVSIAGAVFGKFHLPQFLQNLFKQSPFAFELFVTERNIRKKLSFKTHDT